MCHRVSWRHEDKEEKGGTGHGQTAEHPPSLHPGCTRDPASHRCTQGPTTSTTGQAGHRRSNPHLQLRWVTRSTEPYTASPPQFQTITNYLQHPQGAEFPQRGFPSEKSTALSSPGHSQPRARRGFRKAGPKQERFCTLVSEDTDDVPRDIKFLHPTAIRQVFVCRRHLSLLEDPPEHRRHRNGDFGAGLGAQTQGF